MCLAVFSFAGTFAQKTIDYTDAGKIFRDVDYEKLFDRAPLYMDVFLPTGVNAQMPFVILIHGGGFSTGNRKDIEVTARDLMKANIACAIIDYKLLTRNVFIDNKEPSYKEMVLEIWHAIQYVQFRSKDWNVRSTGYTLLGQESGGFLALLAGYKFKHDVQKIVAVSPITDLREISKLGGMKTNYSSTKMMFTKLMGNVAYNNERYLPTVYTDGNPIDQIKNVPTLLIHGAEDLSVPFSQSEKMFMVLQDKNVSSELIRVPEGKSHLLQDHDFNTEITNAIIKWIQ